MCVMDMTGALYYKLLDNCPSKYNDPFYIYDGLLVGAKTSNETEFIYERCSEETLFGVVVFFGFFSRRKSSLFCVAYMLILSGFYESIS